MPPETQVSVLFWDFLTGTLLQPLTLLQRFHVLKGQTTCVSRLFFLDVFWCYEEATPYVWAAESARASCSAWDMSEVTGFAMSMLVTTPVKDGALVGWGVVGTCVGWDVGWGVGSLVVGSAVVGVLVGTDVGVETLGAKLTRDITAGFFLTRQYFVKITYKLFAHWSGKKGPTNKTVAQVEKYWIWPFSQSTFHVNSTDIWPY